MKPPLYKRTLTADLDRWIEDGLVPAKNRNTILASIGADKGNLSAVGILAMLGAIFMALAALTFIGANWGGISKIVRFGLVLALMWTALGVTLYALKRKTMAFAHAFALVAAALFGAGIMLVAQIFNISAHYPNGIFIWALGALAVAIAMPSRPVLLLSAGLTALWMQVSHIGPLGGLNPLIWLLVPLLVTLWAAARRMRAKDSVHIVVLTGIVWAIHILALAQRHEILHDFEATTLFATLMLGVLLWAGIGRAHTVFGAGAGQLWGGSGLLISAFIVQFNFDHTTNIVAASTAWLIGSAILLILIFVALLISRRAGRYRTVETIIPAIGAIMLFGVAPLHGYLDMFGIQVLYGTMFFAGAVLALLKGAQNNQKRLLWLGGIAFATEALYAYFETFKDLLSTSLFFLIGGLLLLFMALIAMRFGKRLGKGEAS